MAGPHTPVFDSVAPRWDHSICISKKLQGGGAAAGPGMYLTPGPAPAWEAESPAVREEQRNTSEQERDRVRAATGGEVVLDP